MPDCLINKSSYESEYGEMVRPLLSVCIATRNRASYVGQTLDSILRECGGGVEVVVVDGASTDDTATVISERTLAWPNLRYYPQTTNSGIDGDFDKAVELARGKYCWLMSDDDFLAPGAVDRVLAACEQLPDAVLVDAEVRTSDFAEVIVARRLGFSGERHYSSADADRLLVDCGQHLTFIGGFVVRRQLWLQRERRKYYGSEFIHVGVLFQAPLSGDVIVIGEPLVRIRYGVGNWTGRSFQVWMFKWPALIWSFEWLSEAARTAVSPRNPWQRPGVLALYRAKGWYSWRDFTQSIWPAAKPAWKAWLAGLIAMIPGWLLNAAALTYAKVWRQDVRGGIYDLRRSRYYLGRRSGV